MRKFLEKIQNRPEWNRQSLGSLLRKWFAGLRSTPKRITLYIWEILVQVSEASLPLRGWPFRGTRWATSKRCLTRGSRNSQLWARTRRISETSHKEWQETSNRKGLRLDFRRPLCIPKINRTPILSARIVRIDREKHYKLKNRKITSPLSILK